jgi:hypothetical protein
MRQKEDKNMLNQHKITLTGASHKIVKNAIYKEINGFLPKTERTKLWHSEVGRFV